MDEVLPDIELWWFQCFKECKIITLIKVVAIKTSLQVRVRISLAFIFTHSFANFIFWRYKIWQYVILINSSLSTCVGMFIFKTLKNLSPRKNPRSTEENSSHRLNFHFVSGERRRADWMCHLCLPFLQQLPWILIKLVEIFYPFDW